MALKKQAAIRIPPFYFQLLSFTSILVFFTVFVFIIRSPDPTPATRFPTVKLDPPGADKPIPDRKSNANVSFPYFSGVKFDSAPDFNVKICIATTTSDGLEEILPWIFYHKVVGITDFLLFVEGKAASIASHQILSTIQGVKLINRTQELDTQQAKSGILKEWWVTHFLHKPCNYELFVKQMLNMEIAIILAREAGMDWIVNIDIDELLYPSGSGDYSVQQLLLDVPKSVDMVIFPNYESAVERDDIKEPFSEVTMFKKNSQHFPEEPESNPYPIKEASFVQGSPKPSYFLTYENGKSAARIQDFLRPNGAHRWSNYNKIPSEVIFEDAAVLHYSYSKFSDLTSRRQRCECGLTREALEGCFMLDFDMEAYVIASTGTDEQMLQWYREHVVWSDKEQNSKLLKEGVLTRTYTPLVIMQTLKASGAYNATIASGAYNATVASGQASNSTTR